MINSKANIYDWAFQEEQVKNENMDKSNLDSLLKTDKKILTSNLKKDSSLIKINQIDDLNKDHPAK